MNETKILKLYKYMSISSRSLSIIESGKIYYPKPAKFNDPFDCGLSLCNDLTIDEKIQVLRAAMEKKQWPEEKITKEIMHSITPQGTLNDVAEGNISKLTADIHGKRDNMGVLSLSETCVSILMWSHYADEHKGMCIEFAVPVNEKLFKVDYSTNVPRCTLHDIFVENDSEGVIALFTTKHENWQYEGEYRVMWGNGGDDLYDIPGPITSIIFGLLTPPSDIALVRKVATGLGDIRFLKCKRGEGKFGVKIEDELSSPPQGVGDERCKI